MDLAQFGFRQFEDASLEGVLESASVAERSLRHARDHFQGGAQRVLAVVEAQVQVHTADAERVHFTVQVEIHLARASNIPVRADAFDEDLLVLEFDHYFLVTLRIPQTDADGSFHRALR